MPTGTTLRRISINFVFGMMTFLILSTVLLIAWRLFQQHDPVIMVNPAHVVSGRVRAGDVMKIEADFADQGVCQTETGRFLWRFAPGTPPGEKPRKEFVILQSNNVSFSDPGPNHPTVDIKLQHYISPGPWFYFARSERTCGLWDRLFGPDIGRTPDAPVWIDPPG